MRNHEVSHRVEKKRRKFHQSISPTVEPCLHQRKDREWIINGGRAIEQKNCVERNCGRTSRVARALKWNQMNYGMKIFLYDSWESSGHCSAHSHLSCRSTRARTASSSLEFNVTE
jgi:hypothetical protein